MNDQSAERLLGRIERLERESRRLKLGCLVFALGAVSLLLMGQVSPPRVIEAQGIRIRNSSGQIVADFGTHITGGEWEGLPMLIMYDRELTDRVTIALAPDGSGSVGLFGSKIPGRDYRSSAFLTVAPGGGLGEVYVYDNAGHKVWSAP